MGNIVNITKKRITYVNNLCIIAGYNVASYYYYLC